MIDNLEKCLMDAYNKAVHEIAEEEKYQERYYSGYHSGLVEMRDRFSAAIKQMEGKKE